jgi:hypothetical protein
MSPMNRCPVSGYDELREPAYDCFGDASFEICPCCGIEFGYEDASRSHESLRNDWIAKGMHWHSSVKAPPPGWDPSAAAAFGDEPLKTRDCGAKLSWRRHGRSTEVMLDAAARSIRST